MIKNPRKNALLSNDSTYQEYLTVSENLRNSSYFSALPKVMLHFTILNLNFKNIISTNNFDCCICFAHTSSVFYIQLPIYCVELDGDATNLPIIYEDAYQDGSAQSDGDAYSRRHSSCKLAALKDY